MFKFEPKFVCSNLHPSELQRLQALFVFSYPRRSLSGRSAPLDQSHSTLAPAKKTVRLLFKERVNKEQNDKSKQILICILKLN